VIRDIVRTNPILLGFRWWAKIGLKIKPRALPNIVHELVDDPSVYIVAESNGVLDLIIGLMCKNFFQLHQFINHTLPLIQGIETTEVFLQTWPRKYGSFYWPAPKTLETATSNSEECYQLTSLERAILDIITDRGPVSAQKMSIELRVPAIKIRKCIKNMLDNNVYKNEIMVFPAKTEYEIVAQLD
jgi:DNA-binding Lrp family transcriptional regulator